MKTTQESFRAKPEKSTSNMLQVRLSTKSDENLRQLVNSTGISNRTHLVNAAIDLAADVIRTIQQGGNVIYELADGTKVRLKVVGM